MHNLTDTPESSVQPSAELLTNKGEGFSALVRLAQIAEELRRAADRNDLEVVIAAAALLGPTMDQCSHLRGVNAKAAAIAAEIQALLHDCETILTASMQDVGSEMRRLGNGKRALALARSRCRFQAPVRCL